MEFIFLILYGIALLLVFLYSLAQLHLIINYKKAQKAIKNNVNFSSLNTKETPKVTIQLPVYNERYVVDRLLDNIVQLDYPSEKLEIQVLDDSTDDSLVQTKNKVEEFKKSGINIQHITRSDRKGFKAGALKEGLQKASGEFIAIFDADFLPKKDWLQQTIPHFINPEIGVVQTRWGHLNRNYSLLTKMQAFALDFHFILEQVGRSFGNHFINFNGTAGVWRKTCILDAGNWHGDTLTEDLDLSYRAQLKGWKFKYLEEVETPAELPMAMSAARSQQFRWNKGAAENFQKNYGKLIADKKRSFSTKFHGFFHLLNSSMFLVILLLAVLSVPVLYAKNQHPELSIYFYILAFLGISTLVFFIGYWVSYKKINGGGFKNFFNFAGMFFSFFSVAMGLSVHNSLAILEGHFGKKSAFVRTPKFNVKNVRDSWKTNVYLKQQFSFTQFIELGFVFYFAFAIYSAFKINEFGLLAFHFMLFFGFSFVSWQSFILKK
ncbi:cellulose synthase family protein [Mesonia aquimarina]|uniref:cellulose synthase family protein n=1 Tax=Mesonia aquimarina TaxID=1504967 RepID=UPI000EF5CB16|nr:cellulose synthase family protein [Mesonia aquimarina]